jgi:hypothetical protein
MPGKIVPQKASSLSASWDKSRLVLVDAKSGCVMARLLPLDKEQNA